MKRRIHTIKKTGSPSKRIIIKETVFLVSLCFQLDQNSGETNSSGERNLKLINMKLNNLHGTSQQTKTCSNFENLESVCGSMRS